MPKRIFILFFIFQIFISIQVLGNNKETQSISKSENTVSYPVFNDPVVQKYVDDYRILFQNLVLATEEVDIKKLRKLNIQTEKMKSKAPDIKKRLAKDPDEKQNFYDELKKIFKEFDNEMLRLEEKKQ